jgi:hypothetical protein
MRWKGRRERKKREKEEHLSFILLTIPKAWGSEKCSTLLIRVCKGDRKQGRVTIRH